MCLKLICLINKLHEFCQWKSVSQNAKRQKVPKTCVLPSQLLRLIISRGNFRIVKKTIENRRNIAAAGVLACLARSPFVCACHVCVSVYPCLWFEVRSLVGRTPLFGTKKCIRRAENHCLFLDLPWFTMISFVGDYQSFSVVWPSGGEEKFKRNKTI